jgi:hypothetical protein
MEINGKKVVDATKPIIIHITPRDAIEGANKNPSSCAAARAVKRDVAECVSARVHIGRVYVETPTKWIRYQTPDALRTEIIAFDRGGTFEPGNYKLQIPFSAGAHSPGAGKKRENSKTKSPRRTLIAKVKRHEVTGIRPKGATR